MRGSPIPAKSRSTITASLLLLVVIANIASVVWGVSRYGEAFRLPLPAWDAFRILAEQLAGPIYTMAFSILFLWVGLAGKRIAWWMGLAGLLGPIYTPTAVGGLSHDFSHVVFQSCSGIYGTWILWLNIVAGGLVVFHCVLNRRNQMDLEASFISEGDVAGDS